MNDRLYRIDCIVLHGIHHDQSTPATPGLSGDCETAVTLQPASSIARKLEFVPLTPFCTTNSRTRPKSLTYPLQSWQV